MAEQPVRRGWKSPFFTGPLKIFTGLVFLMTLLSSFGGHIDPLKVATPSLLSLFMPYLTLLSVILIIIWILYRNVAFPIAGCVILIISISLMNNAIPFGYTRKPTPGAETFKIISWNVLHTRDIRQPDYPGNRAIEYMINSGADIICLTELYNFSDKEMKKVSKALRDSFDTAYPYKAGPANHDIKVISKYPVKIKKIPGLSLKERNRFDIFNVEFPDKRNLIVVMVHLYSYGLSKEEREVVTEIKSVRTAEKSMRELKGTIYSKMKTAFRNRTYKARVLRKILDELPPDQPLIVCGDFNDVPSSWTYNLIKGADLRDAYAETNFGPASTYNLHLFYFHIDQMLYRGNLRALDLNIGKINTSDHYPLIGEFEFSSPLP